MQLPRFYPILDVSSVRARGLETSVVANEILEAGAAILQFRYKEFFTREIFSELEQVAGLCRRAGATLIVNDRADIARMLASQGFNVGVHLGQEDLAPLDARRVTGAEMMIGFSTHNERQLRDAVSQPADYLAFGPIFGTSSKQNPDPVVGIEELRRLRPVSSRPLVAIGGITRANARSVIEAGADSVAVIGDLFPVDATPMSPGRIRARAAEWIAFLEF
jgi:thiamine-phosphate pyrophosphorylase